MTKKETKYCEVGNKKFKELNKSFQVERDLVATARNIYYYVRDNIKYEDYSNTKRGAYKTLEDKKGNCCDQAHLLVALLLTAEIPTYYAHGKNHWWAVPCIDKQYHCDPTNMEHDFGNPNNNHGGDHSKFKLFEELDH